jgi:hypothetical protein
LCDVELSYLTFCSETGVLAVVGVSIPVSALHSIITLSFPTECDGVLFLCWILDERGYVLYARDLHCSKPAVSCIGNSFTAVRPLVASRLVSSGIFQMNAVYGSSSVVYSMFRNRSLLRNTVHIAASHDDTAAASEQQLEVNVLPLADTSATVVVLSGAGMQVSGGAFACALTIFLGTLFVSQPVIDANRSGFLGTYIRNQFTITRTFMHFVQVVVQWVPLVWPPSPKTIISFFLFRQLFK